MKLLLPSLKITGGNIEAIRLIDNQAIDTADLSDKRYIWALWGCFNPIKISDDKLKILSKWHSNKFYAPFQFIFLLIKFYLENNSYKGSWIFTHYSTLPFSLFIKKNKRFFFVQDLEWKFINNNLFQLCLKKIILYIYSNGNILAANKYIMDALANYGLTVYSNVNIWADINFLEERIFNRTIDAVMVLRNGHYKRLDLYIQFIVKCKSKNNLTLAVITQEKNIFNEINGSVDFCYYCPSIADMRDIYSRSKTLIHLSDHEGFGLPPLEAMGAGCIPLCRDSGGVRAYMDDLNSHGLLLPKSYDIDKIYHEFEMLLKDSKKLENLSRRVIILFKLGFKREKFIFRL